MRHFDMNRITSGESIHTHKTNQQRDPGRLRTNHPQRPEGPNGEEEEDQPRRNQSVSYLTKGVNSG